MRKIEHPDRLAQAKALIDKAHLTGHLTGSEQKFMRRQLNALLREPSNEAKRLAEWVGQNMENELPEHLMELRGQMKGTEWAFPGDVMKNKSGSEMGFSYHNYYKQAMKEKGRRIRRRKIIGRETGRRPKMSDRF